MLGDLLRHALPRADRQVRARRLQEHRLLPARRRPRSSTTCSQTLGVEPGGDDRRRACSRSARSSAWPPAGRRRRSWSTTRSTASGSRSRRSTQLLDELRARPAEAAGEHRIPWPIAVSEGLEGATTLTEAAAPQRIDLSTYEKVADQERRRAERLQPRRLRVARRLPAAAEGADATTSPTRSSSSSRTPGCAAAAGRVPVRPEVELPAEGPEADVHVRQRRRERAGDVQQPRA